MFNVGFNAAILVPEGWKVAKGDQDGGKAENSALAERFN